MEGLRLIDREEEGWRPEESTRLPDHVIAERRCQSAAEEEEDEQKEARDKRGQLSGGQKLTSAEKNSESQ